MRGKKKGEKGLRGEGEERERWRGRGREESFSLEKNRAREKGRDRERERERRVMPQQRTIIVPPGTTWTFALAGNAIAVGCAVRRATKLCPVLHEDRLVLSARDPPPCPPLRYTKLPSPARCASLHSRRCPMSARGFASENASTSRETGRIFIPLDDPKTKRLLSCQLSETRRGGGEWLAGRQTVREEDEEKVQKIKKKRRMFLSWERIGIYRVNNRGLKKKKKKRPIRRECRKSFGMEVADAIIARASLSAFKDLRILSAGARLQLPTSRPPRCEFSGVVSHVFEDEDKIDTGYRIPFRYSTK